MSRKQVYLIVTILGTVVPYVFFGRFIAQNGVDLPLFAKSLFVNGAAGGFSADLLITSFVFWYWSYDDSKKHGVSRWWLIPVTNLTIGLSCALPLYFYLRASTLETADR